MTALIPAIDLREGQCVRLLQGDFDRQTDYAADPVTLARDYAQAGAGRLHVVDLDGARAGEPRQGELIGQMSKAAGVPVQCGGGIRNSQQIRALLASGIHAVVVGTRVVQQPVVLGAWLQSFGDEHVVAALDVRADAAGEFHPATQGWEETDEGTLDGLLDRLANFGLKQVLCTDISRDGTLEGPNTELYAYLVARGLSVQASGGVGSLDDLAELKRVGVDGVIVGKALLEGRFSVAEAMACLQDD